jgi:hypothetical protein
LLVDVEIGVLLEVRRPGKRLRNPLRKRENSSTIRRTNTALARRQSSGSSNQMTEFTTIWFVGRSIGRGQGR